MVGACRFKPLADADEWKSARSKVKEYGQLPWSPKEKGFSELKKIIGVSAKVLASGGMLALEFGGIPCGPNEGVVLEFKEVEILKDLSHYRQFSIAIKT